MIQALSEKYAPMTARVYARTGSQAAGRIAFEKQGVALAPGKKAATHVVLHRRALRVPRPVRLLLDPAAERADLGTRLRVRPVGELKHAVELVVLVDPAGVVDALGAERAAKGFRVGVDRRVVLPPGGVSVGWSPIKSARDSVD